MTNRKVRTKASAKHSITSTWLVFEVIVVRQWLDCGACRIMYLILSVLDYFTCVYHSIYLVKPEGNQGREFTYFIDGKLYSVTHLHRHTYTEPTHTPTGWLIYMSWLSMDHPHRWDQIIWLCAMVSPDSNSTWSWLVCRWKLWQFSKSLHILKLPHRSTVKIIRCLTMHLPRHMKIDRCMHQ